VNFLKTLATYGVPVADEVEGYVQSGAMVYLFDLPSPNDPQRPAILFYGIHGQNPDFSGAGHFTVDMTQLPSEFAGARQGTSFIAFAPIGPPPPTWVIPMHVFSTVVMIPFQCYRLAINFIDDHHISGTVQGWIRQVDLQWPIDVQLAQALNNEIQSNPATGSAILVLFDVGDGNGGDCVNPDGTLGVPGDGVISPCEVLNDPGIKKAITPDLAIYDANGMVDPAHATKKDSLSFGFGFSAVSAFFQ
jgi:hypothetical protein